MNKYLRKGADYDKILLNNFQQGYPPLKVLEGTNGTKSDEKIN